VKYLQDIEDVFLFKKRGKEEEERSGPGMTGIRRESDQRKEKSGVQNG
jgi:hypothetical protein